MFIGREREVAALDRLYESNKFEFAVIYGRRRVGKTVKPSDFISCISDIKNRFTLWVLRVMKNKISKTLVKA